jgi:beta-lactamase class A
LHDEYTLEKRIRRETASFSGITGIYADDLRGRVVELCADEEFETASTIKSFILADLFLQVREGRKNLSDMLVYEKENYISGSGILKCMDEGAALSAKNMAALMIIVSDNIATNVAVVLGKIHDIRPFIFENKKAPRFLMMT